MTHACARHSAARNRRPRLTLLCALLAIGAGTGAGAGSGGATAFAAASASPAVAPSQELAVLLTAQPARRSPQTAAPVVATVTAERPITGEQTTLPVLAQTTRQGIRWLEVALPGRPNGLTGWIVRRETRELTTGWHVVVERSARRVLIYRHGVLTRSFRAVVGKPSTPTPSGQFFVEEDVKMPANEAGGPFALALSARSDALKEFDGGPGQIAIHGRDLLGGVLGQAASHGCIRLAAAAITWIAARIGPGVPVTIQ